MRLGWLQGELALGPLWPLHHNPRLGSSFRKLGLTPPRALQSSGLEAGCFTRSRASPCGVGEACRKVSAAVAGR